jgi:hypothetical protein
MINHAHALLARGFFVSDTKMPWTCGAGGKRFMPKNRVNPVVKI